MDAALFVIMAYLMGSVSFGILVCKAFGLPDPRTHGSGNPGATNVMRSGKKAAALLTLLGDAGKGWLAVWLAQRLGLSLTVVCVVAGGVFLGHVYPVFHGFKGGKGVATAAGALLALSPWLGSIVLGTWLLIFSIWRISSLAALVSAGLAPLFAAAIWGLEVRTATVVGLSLMLVWRHRSNIRKLLDGTETRFGKPGPGAAPPRS
ncbi:MAG: glycerol-3-phosphate 1-O-acyltransferase PlsY [Methylophilaceae bacterium]|nr:glycerol-3-phosphate 1-O-acyltransferase PlsY [Methylophilaceae bacterium]